MWYYYSKKSCNSPRKIRYIRYLINRTTKRTTRMIIEKRKKKEEKSSARNIPPHPITSIYKNYQNSADSLFDQSVSSKNRGGGSGKKKNILYTLWTVSAGRGNNISEYENRVEKRWWTKRNWQTTVRTKLCPKGLKLRTTRDRNKQLLSSGSVRVT